MTLLTAGMARTNWKGVKAMIPLSVATVMIGCMATKGTILSMAEKAKMTCMVMQVMTN